MCCLQYEQNAYEYLLKITPKPGTIVETNEGAGTVVDFSLLTGKLKVQLHSNPDAAPKFFHRREVKLVRDSKIRVAKEEIEALKDIEG
jgi:cell fate regulator YaaT (PSP1 superfamily)